MTASATITLIAASPKLACFFLLTASMCDILSICLGTSQLPLLFWESWLCSFVQSTIIDYPLGQLVCAAPPPSLLGSLSKSY